MSIVDIGKLALIALQQGSLLLADRSIGYWGKLPPIDAKAFATPANLNRVLNDPEYRVLNDPKYRVLNDPEYRVLNDSEYQVIRGGKGKLIDKNDIACAAASVSIDSVSRLDCSAISSNCDNLVLAIEQANNDALPETLFLKLPMRDLGTRWFFSIIGSWQLETWFFRELAWSVPLRTPVTYAAHCQNSRFFLIQENLKADPSVQLFTNLDMMAGASLELSRRVLDAFAQLHAHHYELPEEQRNTLLPLELHPFLSPNMRLVAPALNRLGLQACVKKNPGIIPDDVIDVYRKTLRHWDALLDFWFSGQLSLLHGDSHLGNIFVSGDAIGMLDFQAVHWGKGVRDVQYFLIDSLPGEVLAANEQELLRYYVERRCHYGSAIDFDETWQQYRSFTYHTLMTIVVSIGLGALNPEQNELMEEILRRAVAAVQRVDYSEWLDGFLSQ